MIALVTFSLNTPMSPEVNDDIIKPMRLSVDNFSLEWDRDMVRVPKYLSRPGQTIW